MKKSEILAKLREIERLELDIEARIIDTLEPIFDLETGVETNEGNINDAVIRLADQITSDPTNINPVLISIMDGALPFTSALLAELTKRHFQFQFATMQSTSYNGTTSGTITTQERPKINVAGRHVILIDEVIDTAKTLSKLYWQLKRQGARDVKTALLVDKDQPRTTFIKHPTYRGFVVSKDAFIVGKGLDYNGLVRNLSFIGGVHKDALPTPEEKAILDTKDTLCKALEEHIRNDAKNLIACTGQRWFRTHKATQSINQETQIVTIGLTPNG